MSEVEFGIIQHGDRQISFRPITAEDGELLHRIYASTREDELKQTNWTPEQKEAFTRMQSSAQHAHYMEHYAEASFCVILVDGEPAGRLYVLRQPDDIRLVDIALLPEFRGSGIGTAILRPLQEEARESGRTLSIHVEVFNPAMRLYERLGFVRVEEYGVYWLMEWKASAD